MLRAKRSVGIKLYPMAFFPSLSWAENVILIPIFLVFVIRKVDHGEKKYWGRVWEKVSWKVYRIWEPYFNELKGMVKQIHFKQMFQDFINMFFWCFNHSCWIKILFDLLNNKLWQMESFLKREIQTFSSLYPT